MELIDSLVPIFFFLGVAMVSIKLFETRHRENMALIDRGMRKSDLHGFARRVANPYSSLKFGLLLIFAGVGVITGESLHEYLGMPRQLITTATTMIGGGLGLFIYYLVAHKKIDVAMAAKPSMEDVERLA